VVLLVSATYVCENNHRLLAHDESILKHFPERRMIPFELQHRAGFTLNFLDTCTALVTHGLNFYNIESFIIERRWEAFERQKHLLSLHERIRGGSRKFWASQFSNIPSNDLISQCFLSRFLLNEKVYIREMVEIPSGESISFDHTFKVAANIGYNREDGNWIHQYDSLFLVMSEQGKVVTWQLTKGTAFAQVETLLQDLKMRSHDTIKTVYIDDCCRLRGKIKSVFGSDVTVKLDVFHAVQRVTRTLVKRHSQMKDCLKDLQLVFRKDGDSGDKRLEDTPTPEVILSKLNRFMSKWSGIQDSIGMQLFSPETVKATERLKHHITCGCLSDIPPGGGTNRNERIHHHINGLFNKSRIGIMLAYALLTVVLNSYNSSIQKRGQRITRPITASPFFNVDLSDMKPIGIMPKARKEHAVSKSDCWEIDVSENTMDMEIVVPVFLRSLQKYHIHNTLKAMGLSNLQNRTMHFTAYEPVVINDCSDCDINILKEKLSTYGLTLVLAPPFLLLP
jgi:hypothetical protein